MLFGASFVPRGREFGAESEDVRDAAWIPAVAGMTEWVGIGGGDFGDTEEKRCKAVPYPRCHSRDGGNPRGLRVVGDSGWWGAARGDVRL